MVCTHVCAACAHTGPEEGVECPAPSCHHFLREGLSRNLGLGCGQQAQQSSCLSSPYSSELGWQIAVK